MGQIGQIIASAATPTLLYAERLLVGVTPDMFARLAQPGGAVVRSNHPAFVLGHLSLYPPKILERLSQPAGAAAYPPAYEALFKSGVECQDDPAGTIYPPMKALTKQFFEGYRAARLAIEAAPDDLLCGPNPAEGRMREMFPVLGGMLNFYLTGHAQSHLGQLSAWRRAMGLPAA
jgi:hypothetical protein